MPAFCRHNRLLENCPICSKKPRVSAGSAGGGAPKRERAAAARPRPSGAKRRAPQASGVTVRRLARAEDDGYDNDLVPGLRASADADRLARCLAAAAQDLDSMRAQPRALGAVAAELAPSAGPLDAAALTAGAGTPEARFDRAYERLARPGMGRPERVRLLIAAWAHGALPDVEPWTLRLGDAAASDPVLLAVKRLFGTGDALLLGRRLRALCDDAGVPVAAAEDGLRAWQDGEDPEFGAGAGPAVAALGVAHETPAPE